MTNILKVLHVLFAASWVGSDVMFEALSARARKSKDPAAMASFISMAEDLGKAYFPIISTGTWLFGLLLAFQGGYRWAPWLYFGPIAVAVTLFIGFGILKPTAAKLKSGQAGANAPKLAKRMVMGGHLATLILLLTVVDMVVKPGA